MIGDISGAQHLYLITGYTDMRKSIDGLCAIVRDQLKLEPDQRSIFLFCGAATGSRYSFMRKTVLS